MYNQIVDSGRRRSGLRASVVTEGGEAHRSSQLLRKDMRFRDSGFVKEYNPRSM